MKIKLRMIGKGRLMIPKKVGDSSIELMPLSKKSVSKEWEEIARREGCNVSKIFIYGDKIYEKWIERIRL